MTKKKILLTAAGVLLVGVAAFAINKNQKKSAVIPKKKRSSIMTVDNPIKAGQMGDGGFENNWNNGNYYQ